MLSEDGKKNSLGRVNDVIDLVLDDQSRLSELYVTITHEDAWVRMRAIDAFEKICRSHPDWIAPYIDDIQTELAQSTQASIKWHIAQIYSEIELSEPQKKRAVKWLTTVLSSKDIDWIVAANSISTLAYFVRNGDASKSVLLRVLGIQKDHKSSAVVRRANKILLEFSLNASA